MLGHERASPGFRCRTPRGEIVEQAQDYDSDVRRGFLQQACGCEAINAAHAHVHYDDVRVEMLDEGDDAAPIFGFTDDFEVGFGGECHCEAPPHLEFVIY